MSPGLSDLLEQISGGADIADALDRVQESSDYSHKAQDFCYGVEQALTDIMSDLDDAQRALADGEDPFEGKDMHDVVSVWLKAVELASERAHDAESYLMDAHDVLGKAELALMRAEVKFQ